MPSTILSDNGVSSGSAGLKTTASNDGILALQTTTAGGTATTAMTINTSQNVGIGTTSPAVRLHLTGDNPFIRFDDNSGGSQQDYEVGSESALFKIKNVGQATEPLVIDNSGNVGIGTSSPAARLESFLTSTTTPSFRLRYNSTSYYFDASMDGNGNTIFMVPAANGVTSGIFTFGSAGAERMRLDTSGVLRVNNTSTPSGNGGFGGEIAYIGNGSNGSLFYTTAAVGSGTALECTRQNDGAGIYFFRNGSAAGFINITTGAISVNNSSDYRLKENVETVTGSLAKVMQVRPVTFNWKENGATGKSVIAHELQEVFPEVVFGEKDAVNEDGSVKPQSVALGNLVPDLIVAIQELKAIVDAQAAEIAALKGN